MLTDRLNGVKPVVRNASASSTSSANDSSDNLAFADAMKSIISKKKPVKKVACSQDQAVRMMVNDYANAPVVTNAFDFWREKSTGNRMEAEFSRLAKRYLPPPATTVDCERLFSTAGQILTDKRNRLKADKVEKLLFQAYRG